ncbi:MAG: hypothetical protein IIV27_03775 [Clostridia bacterium]|nr:hypothetical protein [Clostridia bacterium]
MAAVMKKQVWKETFQALAEKKGVSLQGASRALGKSGNYLSARFCFNNPAYFTSVQVLAMQALLGCTAEEILEEPEIAEIVEPEAFAVDPADVLKLIDQLREIVVKWADQ